MTTDLSSSATLDADGGSGRPPTAPGPLVAGPAPGRPARVRLRRAALPVLTTAAILLAWELLAWTGSLPEEIPAVSSILVALAELVPSEQFVVALADTVWQLTVGMVLGGAVGVAFGVALGTVPLLHRTTRYVLDFLRSIPAVVYLPVLILVLGATPEVSYVLGAVGALWPMLFQTYYGVVGVPPLLQDTGRVFGLTRTQQLRAITLPSVAPFLATGLRIAASHVLVVVVAVEIIASVDGLGAEIAVYATNAVYPEMYALVLVVGVLGVGMNALLARLERAQLHWHVTYRKGDA